MDPFSALLGGGQMLTSFLGGQAQARANRSAMRQAAEDSMTAGNMRAGAIEQAAPWQLAGLDQAEGATRSGYDAALGELGPNRQDATDQLYADTGAGSGGFGAVQNRLRQGFAADPGYQFRLDQGQRALQRGMNRMGLMRSGNFAKAATDYGQGAASQEYGNYFSRWQDYMNRMAQLSGQEQQRGAQRAGFQVDRGNALSRYPMMRGDVRAGAITGAADARAEGLMGASSANVQGMVNKGNIQAGMWNNAGNALSYWGGRGMGQRPMTYGS